MKTLFPRALLRRGALHYPNKRAYVCGARAATWDDMHRRSDRFARALQDLHILVVDDSDIQLAVTRHQNAVAGVQRVGDRRFPAAGARSGEHHHGTGFGFENLFQIGEQAQRQIAQIPAITATTRPHLIAW